MIVCLPAPRDKKQIDRIVDSLGLKISARDSPPTNPRVHLFALCSQWLPLARATLGMVVQQLPSPLNLSEERVEKLMCGATQTFQSLPHNSQVLKESKHRLATKVTQANIALSSQYILFPKLFVIVDNSRQLYS